MAYQLVDFFKDPILKAPTIGSMFMCAAASLVGVIVFIRRKSLIGETLSHAAYPGLVLSAVILSYFFVQLQDWFSILFLLGSFVSCFLGLAILLAMQKYFFVKSDAALCFVLSSFFGIGVLFASRLQFSHPLWFRQIQVFLYGQTATLLDVHIWIYGVFFLVVLLFIVVFYRFIQIGYFDRGFSYSIGLSLKQLDGLFFFLLVFSVIIAMKSIGVVLLSGMFVAPALAARRFTNKLCLMFWIAGFAGALSAFFGNYFSVKIVEWSLAKHFLLPTGPMIVLFCAFFAIGSLFFSPDRKKRGKEKWTGAYLEENYLKSLFYAKCKMTKKQIAAHLGISQFSTRKFLQKALFCGWIEMSQGVYFLSLKGKQKVDEIEEFHVLCGKYWLFCKEEGKKYPLTMQQIKKQAEGDDLFSTARNSDE